ncbi:MAG: hypothetical protein LJE58_02045 [Thiogranum sp.]|nr:hypothetical protein [Thiogranum sp.]
MEKYDTLLRLLILLAGFAIIPQAQAAGCLDCHRDMRQGLSPAHAALADDCSRCHAGQDDAPAKDTAHTGMLAFPGNLGNAARACGQCHADKVDSVNHSLMHTGRGMIETTRQVFAETTDRPGHNDLQHLTQSPADSLLRKLCASCHLGQPKTVRRIDATSDRGGGCLACHIDHYPGQGHPALTARVSDARCFGCHSRSGRISLSYAGLAEVDDTDRAATAATGRLNDGRRVEFRSDDRHHAAGMSCIDCHTVRDLMGTGATASALAAGQTQVDIACVDCHEITRTIKLNQWPDDYRQLQQRIPFPTSADSRFAVTASGTPLWHIELRGDQTLLHRKDGQGTLSIPPYRASSHPLATQHARLSCSACHAGWAPQCYGCHLQYDPAGQQFDHASGKKTRGLWRELRATVRNDLPPLGVTPGNQIVPVVPGMIMTVEHPDWPVPHFVRRFAALEPHTTASARPCESCHRSSTALGLGQGTLRQNSQGVTFQPDLERLEDGLAADAWTSTDKLAPNGAAAAVRPFTGSEMKRILATPLPVADKAVNRD